jgi:hypothetical protein
MKYKVGDKVKIRTWDDMSRLYGVTEYGQIEGTKDKRYPTCFFNRSTERRLGQNVCDRIVTIKKVFESYYYMREIGEFWQDYMIECLAEDYKKPVRIKNRFEILDL